MVEKWKNNRVSFDHEKHGRHISYIPYRQGGETKVYKCQNCGNETLFYNNVTVEAKQVFNQKTGKQYIRDKTDMVDDYSNPIICYKCDELVEA